MRDPTPPTTPSSQPQLIPTPFPRPPSSSHVLPSADPLTNEVVVATARPSSSSSLASPHTGAPSASVAASSSSSSSSSSSDAARLHATSKMSDVAPESRDDDPSSVSTTKVSNHHHHAPSDSLPSSASSEPPLLHPNPHSTSLQLSIAVASAIPSAHTSPGAQTPELNSTVSTLQLASEALSNIPQQDPNATDVPVTAVQLLSAFQRKSKKVPAIQSPHPGSARSRSAATTPVPPSLLLGLKNDSFDVTAASSRATTPTRTPSGRAKRQRRERNAATPVASVSALPSIEQNDRRRSARVAKAVTASASDSPNMPNLALFGFSPYLENLVMNAKETDRRTRSGGRGIRPPVDRAPTRLKRGTAKSKTKETDPDGPDDEAKIDLYRQLCIISYQLQAHLDMVPHKSLEELRAQFATPPPEEDDGKLPPSASSDNTAAASLDPNGATKPPVPMQKHDQPSEPHPDSSNYQPPIVVKAEPPQSPQLSHLDLQPSKPAFSPESSPEVALMHGLRPTFNDDPPHHPPYAQGGFQSYGSREPNPWPAKVDEVQDEPMSPVFRPARANIMSISALMDGPSRPAKPRTPSPELIRTPPQPEEPLPSFMHEWTEQDEMASQFLSACAAAIPKLDTTELDRLTQIAQLAAFDLEMLSVPSTPRASTPSSGLDEQQRQEAILKFDPRRLNPLDTLDTQQLYDIEEAEYRDELQASEELYESVRYLESFDQVVDEWRAGELARLRLQLELRKAEVDRIWTCDRKFAWSNFVNDRAGELYRRAAMEASHAKWQAEMELDLLAVHRRKTKGFAKLTKDIWVPDAESLADPEVAQLYAKYGRFVSGVKHAVDGPLVRADLRKMRAALRAYKTLSKQADQSKDVAETAGQDDPEVHLQAEGEAAEPAERAAADKAVEAASSEYSSEFEEEEEYDSDSSTASSSSGISSLPAFSSVCSSPVLLSVAGSVDVAAPDLVSEIASVRDAAMDDDSDDEADESLWARQLRLAASRVQTPAASALPSRAASPATSVKVSSAAKKRDRKRKKRPPPPGARLWKKGRVQQDDTSVAGDEDVDMANDERQTAARGEWPNGHRDDGAAQKGEDAVHVPLAQSMKPDTSREPTLDEAYRYDRPMHYGGYGMHRPPYAEYGEYERPPYDDLPFHRDYPVPHQYAPSGGGYAPPPMPTYPNAADAPYVGTPPPPTQHDFAQPPVYPSYNQYAPAPGTYPSHPPPPPPAAGAGAGPGRPQWPY